MRIAKVEELIKEVEILSQNHEREVEVEVEVAEEEEEVVVVVEGDGGQDEEDEEVVHHDEYRGDATIQRARLSKALNGLRARTVNAAEEEEEARGGGWSEDGVDGLNDLMKEHYKRVQEERDEMQKVHTPPC